MAKIFVRLVMLGVLAIFYAVTGKSLRDIPKHVDGADSKEESKFVLRGKKSVDFIYFIFFVGFGHESISKASDSTRAVVSFW